MKLMKTLVVYIIIILTTAFVCECAQAQDVVNPDSIKRQLDKLLESKDPSDGQLLEARLKSLAASNIEMNMSIAAVYYFHKKDAKAYDSVMAAALRKFPKGLEARINAQQAISDVKSLAEMERSYYKFLKDFPPDSYARLPLGEDRLPYDRIRSNLANGYAKEKNAAKAIYFASLLEADFWKVRAYGDLSDVFYKNGDLVNAALYQKKAVESALPYAEGKMGNSPAANFAIKRYVGACSSYAQLLFEQRKYKEGLKFIEIAFKAEKEPGPVVNFLYAEILAALGRNGEAYEKIEAALKSGEGTEEMADLFKLLYVKVNGSDKGLDVYEAEIHKNIMDAMRKRLMKNMVNEPAVNFSLTGLKGNQVNLSDLKGKVVILDFWATWCVPCKASFPAMQMAVDKYKNDPDVEFLFIHTWERSKTPVEDAKAFITGKKYSFQVLMDLKDQEAKTNKVVDSYQVTGIPAKFVIDKRGNIRFKLSGFNGSKKAAVDEMSMMIDLAK